MLNKKVFLKGSARKRPQNLFNRPLLFGRPIFNAFPGPHLCTNAPVHFQGLDKHFRCYNAIVTLFLGAFI